MASEFQDRQLRELASESEQPGSQRAYDKSLEFRIRELEIQKESADRQAMAAERQATAAELSNRTSKISLLVAIIIAVATFVNIWLQFSSVQIQREAQYFQRLETNLNGFANRIQLLFPGSQTTSSSEESAPANGSKSQSDPASLPEGQ